MTPSLVVSHVRVTAHPAYAHLHAKLSFGTLKCAGGAFWDNGAWGGVGAKRPAQAAFRPRRKTEGAPQKSALGAWRFGTRRWARLARWGWSGSALWCPRQVGTRKSECAKSTRRNPRSAWPGRPGTRITRTDAGHRRDTAGLAWSNKHDDHVYHDSTDAAQVTRKPDYICIQFPTVVEHPREYGKRIIDISEPFCVPVGPATPPKPCPNPEADPKTSPKRGLRWGRWA